MLSDRRRAPSQPVHGASGIRSIHTPEQGSPQECSLPNKEGIFPELSDPNIPGRLPCGWPAWPMLPCPHRLPAPPSLRGFGWKAPASWGNVFMLPGTINPDAVPAHPERTLFLFESLPCETLCHRGLPAALPLHCCAQHGTKLPACTFNTDSIAGNPRRHFCAVRPTGHLALRKSWLCWLQLMMHSSSLVSTASTGLRSRERAREP